ncbi:nuclease PIN [Escherichia albertii]|uniref:pilus-assembly fibrillin subunit n=1 Tax=Escherichia albertii TaxID=208962 RepID=UPI0011F377A5|nr:pilus-assembly fibrillin subunit [Escherichia albertii]EJZ2266271.1 nuclease PIN [Escherichia albertii]
MSRTTTGLCLAALLVSSSMSSVLQAGELVMRDDFFVADENRHQWVNENNGRTGTLNVKGALVSSPCILETPEIKLPLQENNGKYVLNIKLSHCGDGLSKTSEQETQVSYNVYVKQHIILKEWENDVPLSEHKGYGRIREVLRNGDNRLVYFMNKEQYEKISDAQSEGALNAMSSDKTTSLQLYILYE